MKTSIKITLGIFAGIGVLFCILFGIYFATTMMAPSEPAKTPSTPPTTPPVTPPVTPPPVTPPQETYDNQEFMDWITTTNNKITDYSNDVVADLNGKYYYSLESDAEAAESYVDAAKIKCNSFDLDTRHNAVRNEYYLFLSDYSWAMFYAKWAGKDMQSDAYTQAIENLNKCTDYTNQATVHLNTVTSLVKGLGN